jgi:spore maturation protein CgeB
MRQLAKRYLLDARTALRNSSLYPYYRPISARRQRASLERLVRKLVQSAKGSNIHDSFATELVARRSARRRLPAVLKDATVIGVGALGWERHGLWPSFERVCNFTLFNDELGIDVPFYCHSKADQRRRSDRLLALVDRLEGRSPVHLCFFYADSSNIGRELLTTLHDRGIWTVLMGLDDRHTFTRFRRGDLDVGVETVAPFVDLYWTSWRAGILLHRSIGSRAWLGGAAADPKFHRPVPTDETIDVLFLGQAYGARRDVVAELRRLGVEVECRGYGWDGGSLSFDDCVRLYSSARIVLGISSVGAMDDVTIMKGRDFEVPMCGACYVTQYTEELSEFFEIGRDIVCYSTPLQAAEMVSTLLSDPARRLDVKRNGLKRSLRGNTWEARLNEMYGILLDPSGTKPIRRNS